MLWQHGSYPFRHLITVTGLGVYAVLAAGSLEGGSEDEEAKSPEVKACENDWRECKNNTQLIENFDGMVSAKVACEQAAKDAAKYGEPEFPWVSFGTYYEGKEYVKSGKVTLIEPDAQFQNGFGAEVNSRVVCEYNLKTEQVTNLMVNSK